MLPASTTRRPAARSRWATIAVVLLLPLVPVMAMVRACGFAANHNAVPEVKRTPAASACITTSR